MKFLFTIISLTVFFSNCAQQNLIDVYCSEDSCTHTVIDPEMLMIERWDTLAQSKFWKTVMNLSSDTCIVNIADTRKILGYVDKRKWFDQDEEAKKSFKDSVIDYNCLDSNTRIYITTGKKDFYLIEEVIPSISKAITVFQDNNVDPWYAQSILLIESPAQLNYSNAGAYGPFQLMKNVARKMGLIVNSKLDERKNFHKSAYAASELLKTICIPNAYRILCEIGDIEPSGNELWFKFLVLHIYHAGAKNVESLLAQQEKPLQGMELIKWMWTNEYGNFKNASQNYSQLAIAAMLTLQDIVLADCDYIFQCNSDYSPNY
tara:strand:+ start:15276 stop:16229 length:954 start_codon:yes stop_codon:yes gene_type:complete